MQLTPANFPFLLLFLNLLCSLLSPDNPTEAGKFLFTLSNQYYTGTCAAILKPGLLLTMTMPV